MSAGHCRLPDEAATLGAGARIAVALRPVARAAPGGLHLHLRGPLGAGKTTLVRGLLRALGVRGPVKSPTYTLVEPYELDGLSVRHLDLYRVMDPEELELLGLRDDFRAGVACVVEWPERGGDWLPTPSLSLVLRHDGPARELRWRALDAAGARLAGALAQKGS
jgi:tRNA threonylcarbamoyladenosine biosynthesis protein TsaE